MNIVYELQVPDHFFYLRLQSALTDHQQLNVVPFLQYQLKRFYQQGRIFLFREAADIDKSFLPVVKDRIGDIFRCLFINRVVEHWVVNYFDIGSFYSCTLLKSFGHTLADRYDFVGPFKKKTIEVFHP